MSGPLEGIRVVEFAGLGPTPFAAMMLSDMGADVLRIDRLSGPAISVGDDRLAFTRRGRPSVGIDLKSAAGRALARELAIGADVLLEGYRPGVMERLGLGPTDLASQGSPLIYARMTGWGQTGALANKAGHDINYISLTGALYMMGAPGQPPRPPLNLVGDYGGGALFVVVGILAALVERGRSGLGQVIDAAMIDGAASLLTEVLGWRASGFWTDQRGANLLDGGAYFYRCYEAADGGWIAVGAIEPQFHAAFITGLGMNPAEFPDHLDRANWPARSARIAARVLELPRAAWVERFADLDACVTPVLSPSEAVADPVNRERAVFAPDGTGQPLPAPRFSRTPSVIAGPPAKVGEGGRATLAQRGIDAGAIAALIAGGALQAS